VGSMFQKNFLITCLLCFISTIFLSCEKPIESVVAHQILTEVPLEYLWESIEKNRFVEAKSEEEIREYIESLIAGSGVKDFPEDYVQAPSQEPYDRGKVLTEEELLEDIEYFFNLMKYGYAGYVLYEEKQWENSKAKITSEALKALRTEPSFTAGRLEYIFQQNLTFINDGHFSFGNKRLNTQFMAYMNKDLNVYKDNEDFVFYEDDKKYRITAINEAEPKEFLQLALDDDGRLIYRLHVLKEAGEDLSVRMSYLSEDALHEELERELRLKPLEFVAYERIAYKQEELKGIPVITSRRFWEQEPGELDAFVESAKSLRNRDIAILDIRGNGGGDSYFPGRWVMKLMEMNPDKIPFEISNWPGILLYRRTNVAEQILRMFGMYPEDPKHGRVSKANSNGWSEPFMTFAEKQFSSTVLLVLTDIGVASAAEAFYSMLSTIDNVIFLGSITYGCLSTGDFGSLTLPSSKITFTVPTLLIFQPTLQNIEGKGFMPDIWVEPGQELERALMFIQNYLPLNKFMGIETIVK
jgi:hypothetical protein